MTMAKKLLLAFLLMSVSAAIGFCFGFVIVEGTHNSDSVPKPYHRGWMIIDEWGWSGGDRQAHCIAVTSIKVEGDPSKPQALYILRDGKFIKVQWSPTDKE